MQIWPELMSHNRDLQFEGKWISGDCHDPKHPEEMYETGV